MFKGINFYSGLNIRYRRIQRPRLRYNCGVLTILLASFGIFSLRMCTNGYLGASAARFTKNHKSPTYELLTISVTYDKLTTTGEVSLEKLTL